MSDSEAGGGLIQEPLKNKLRRLQQGKCTVEDDINANNTIFESLLKELDTLQTQSFQLEITHQEKQELCQKLQFQCKESEQESVRMEFENHLHQLMEQHKKLYFVIKESQPKE
ncbi:synaptonemal complex central element protein 1-like isoform X3 [Entelurus aequoreus]|uniref:synaptonemal complex central element protein 1-like isoform X3 n=1 Tax=Entelurus aequoreus TaxID=161455 RepID=UPI002B1E6DF0|nr:synaptonemal complex central element protein 1-like isoform X3 [Entelurus aequoreus]